MLLSEDSSSPVLLSAMLLRLPNFSFSFSTTENCCKASFFAGDGVLLFIAFLSVGPEAYCHLATHMENKCETGFRRLYLMFVVCVPESPLTIEKVQRGCGVGVEHMHL